MRKTGALWGLIGLFVLMSLTYALVTPLLESPDESSHLQVIHYIATEHALPPYRLPEQTAQTGKGMAYLVSYHKEPLYYAPPLYHTLGALLTWWLPMTDLKKRLVPSEVWTYDWAPTRGTDPWNKNVFVHLPDETIRGSLTARAALVLRIFSLLCSLVTIWCAYNISLNVLPTQRAIALGAAAIVALNPQFAANAVAVSNNPLTIALCSAGILLMLRGLQVPPKKQVRHWLWLGVLTGAACLVKQSCLMLLPVGAFTLFLIGWQHRDRKRYPWLHIIRLGGVYGSITLMICGWWYIRNAVLFGDPLGTGPHYAMEVSLRGFGLSEVWDTFTSYWACFGWQLINLPDWIYVSIFALVLLAITALIVTAIKYPKITGRNASVWQPVLILAAFFIMNLLAYINWAIATGAPYGRLLYPSITPVALLISGGLHSIRTPWSLWLRRILLCGGVVLCAVTPWVTIAPAFRSPVQTNGLPSDMQPVNQQFTHGITLLGYTLDKIAEHPGDTLRATLYWQADSSVEELLTVWVQAASIDPTQQVADDTRWLGGTLYPTPYWRESDIVAHQVTLRMPAFADAPSLYWLRAGLTCDDTDQTSVPLQNGDTFVTLESWAMRPDRQPRIDPRGCTAIFDNSLCLAEAVASPSGTGLTVEVVWQALGETAGDYTVFAHALDGDSKIVAQADARPKQGAFPTNVWQTGDRVTDTLLLDVADADYVLIGWYDASTRERIPVTSAMNAIRPDQAILLTIP